MSNRGMNSRGKRENDRRRGTNSRIFSRKMKSKLAWLFVIIVLALAGLGAVLVRIQSKNGKRYEEIVMSQQNYASKTLPYKRGNISDRNGNLLATSIKVYNVVIDAYVINSGKEYEEDYLEPTVKALDECFEQITADEIRTLIINNPDSRYIVDDRLKKLSYEQIEAMDNILNDTKNNPYVKGVWFEEEYKRMYPYNTLASSTIGFTAAGNVGVTGIEQYYSDYLNGTDGRKYGHVNDDNTMEDIVKEATDGYNLISTIDINLQMICEKYIAKWVEEYNPEKVAVILANPNTGEILAMADNKSIFDLNNPYDISAYYTEEERNAMSDEERMDASNKMWRNFCVSDSFEAGSTIKPFTVAGALEDGKITKDMTFFCDGFEVYDYTIRCHKRAGHGTLNVEQAIMNSCNDCLMQISRLEGVDTFCKYQSLFGFGMKSGIDLPGEISCAGLLFSSDVMTLQDLACNSFGQNFNVNCMQMIAGFSSLINGGNYYKPHVVKQIVNSKGGVIENYDKQLIKQTVTKDTSDFLRQSLYNTVVGGTGKTAAVAGYKVGGKTGTAQHHDKNDPNYLLSFLGFAPYDNPQVVCYAIVDAPDVPDKGSSSYACRLFSEVMTEVLPYMNIFPTEETEPQSSEEGQAQNPSETGENQQGTVENTENNQENNTGTDNSGSEEGNDNQSQGQNEEGQQGEAQTPVYEPSYDENYASDEPAIDYGDLDDGQNNENEDTSQLGNGENE